MLTISEALSWIDKRVSEKGLVLLDGAVGTELERRGYHTTMPLWSGLAHVEVPDLLSEVYMEYVVSGSDIITANTFRTSHYTLSRAGRSDYIELTRNAVTLAKQCVLSSERNVLVAGSIAPLEDCYSPELVPGIAVIRDEYGLQLEVLASSGVDLIIAETMINRNEALVIARICSEMKWPFIMSFTSDQGRLLDGSPLLDVLNEIGSDCLVAVLLNCRHVDIITEQLKSLVEVCTGYIGAYGNGPGKPDSILGWCNSEGSVVEYIEAAQQWYSLGARIIGGCCGTTPETIKSLDEFRRTLVAS